MLAFTSSHIWEAGERNIGYGSETGSALSCQVLSLHLKEPCNNRGGLSPVALLGFEELAPGAGQPIKPRPAIVLGGSLIGPNGILLFEQQQHRIKSALVDKKQVAADLLDTPGDAVPM